MGPAIVRLIAGVSIRLPRLAWAFISAARGLKNGRRRAMAAFYASMVKGGVPRDLALELSRQYPELDIGGLLQPGNWSATRGPD